MNFIKKAAFLMITGALFYCGTTNANPFKGSFRPEVEKFIKDVKAANFEAVKEDLKNNNNQHVLTVKIIDGKTPIAYAADKFSSLAERFYTLTVEQKMQYNAYLSMIEAFLKINPKAASLLKRNTWQNHEMKLKELYDTYINKK